jgi:hypothetical protein
MNPINVMSMDGRYAAGACLWDGRYFARINDADPIDLLIY